MKIWGRILGFAVTIGLVVAVALTLQPMIGRSVYAANDAPPDSDVSVWYGDSFELGTMIKLTDAQRFPQYDYTPIQFKKSNNVDFFYNGLGSIVGVQAFFIVNLGNNQTPRSENHCPGRQRNWIFVDRIDPFDANEYSEEDTIDYADIFIIAESTFTADNFISTEVGSLTDNQAEFKFFYKETGVYRIRIYTQSQSGGFDMNNFIFVVGKQDPSFYPQFTGGLLENRKFSSLKVNTNLLKDNVKSGATSLVNATFPMLTGYEDADTYIKNVTLSPAVGTGSVDFLIVDSIIVSPNGNVPDVIPLKLKADTPIINGKYILRFDVGFIPPVRISQKGIEIEPSTENTKNLVAHIEFTNARVYSFPWVEFITCIIVLALMGGGWYAVGWLAKYAHRQGEDKKKTASEKRAKVEHENMEKLREQVRIQQEQEEALAKASAQANKKSRTSKAKTRDNPFQSKKIQITLYCHQI